MTESVGRSQEAEVNAGRAAEIHCLVRGEMLSGQPFRCHVTGDSMSPLFRTGDRVLVDPDPGAPLRAGDIVQVSYQGDVVTHRLMVSPHMPENTFVITKGDRALAADQPYPVAAVTGRVVGVDRRNRTLVLDGSPWQALAARILVWEWRCLSEMKNDLVRRVLHWCCGRGVRALTNLAWTRSAVISDGR
jgi:signal peptidase I